MRELLSTLIALVILIITSLAGALKASAKNDNDKDARIEAKVWFKDGRIYEGELPKHWLTYRQTFINPGHNFHIVSADKPGKTIKCEASEVDSILITASTHTSFKAGDFYLPAANGKGACV